MFSNIFPVDPYIYILGSISLVHTSKTKFDYNIRFMLFKDNGIRVWPKPLPAYDISTVDDLEHIQSISWNEINISELNGRHWGKRRHCSWIANPPFAVMFYDTVNCRCVKMRPHAERCQTELSKSSQHHLTGFIVTISHIWFYLFGV